MLKHPQILTKFAPSVTYNDFTYQSEGMTGDRGIFFMYEEIYIDLVFMTNLLADYFLLRLVGIIFHCRVSRGRCLAAAILGSVFSCMVVFLTYGEENWMTWLLHGGCAMGMLRIGCGLKKYGLLVKGMITLYLTAFLWGGFFEVLLQEKNISWKLFVLISAGTYMGFSTLLYFSDSMKAGRKNIFPITLSFQGKVHKAYGYYDTGNLLTEPYTGMPVSIISMRFLQEILPEDISEGLINIMEKQGELENTKFAGINPRFIPCRTIGQGEGIITVITLDELCIHTPGEVIHISKPVFGLAQAPFALDKEYEVLLNSRFKDQEGN